MSSQLSQELATKFDSPTFVLSDEAGHHLPEAADPTYSHITDFLAINSTPPALATSGNKASYGAHGLEQPKRKTNSM